MRNFERLIQQVSKNNPRQKKFLFSSIKGLSEDALSELEKYIEYSLSEGNTLDYLALCYDLIVKDTLKEQIYFMKNHHYRYSSYSDVASSVYNSISYMSRYMHGLALTSFLWPQHNKIHNFFVENLPKKQNGSYLEIGPGHGWYFIKAMQLSSFSFFDGIDISSISVDLTKKIINSGFWGKFNNYHIFEADFLKLEITKKYDAVVMGEVLEHVENPLLFLQKFPKIINKGAFIYLTTCINSPAIDHIYLFKSIQHLESHFKEGGLEILQKLIIPYENKSVEQSVDEKLPINVAYILKCCNG